MGRERKKGDTPAYYTYSKQECPPFECPPLSVVSGFGRINWIGLSKPLRRGRGKRGNEGGNGLGVASSGFRVPGSELMAADGTAKERVFYARVVKLPSMKRLRRWLFNGLAAVSLLLFVATAAVWVRSHWVTDVFTYAWPLPPDSQLNPRRELIAVTILPGSLGLVDDDFSGDYITMAIASLGFAHQSTYWQKVSCPGPTNFWNRMGFGAGRYPTVNGSGGNSGKIHSQYLAVPFWFGLLLTSILPLRRFYVFRRDRRIPGFCDQCGYDLRATPDRCPECGIVPEHSDV